MRTNTRHRGRHRIGPTSLVGSAALVAVGAVMVALLAGASGAATSVAPTNTGEPAITGTPQEGQRLTSTTGSWSGSKPMSFARRWLRCGVDGGKPDGSNCLAIVNATASRYVLQAADVGFRLRVRVTATNADGSATVASNATTKVAAAPAKPTNTTEPSISGSAVVGSVLNANRGTWVGNDPITYSFVWLRCSTKGDNCSEIHGATDNQYQVVANDVGRTIRVRVIARNDLGSASAISNATGVVGSNQPPPGGSLAVGDLVAAGDRLVISSIRFSPNPVTSRTAPITARVRVTARGGRPVKGALVFMRGTPRVVSGQTRATRADGWVTLRLIPNQLFPQPRTGFNVQFFIKAFRNGDPVLGGIAGYRLVQVRLAG